MGLAPPCPALPRLAPACPYLPPLLAPTCPYLPPLPPTCPYLPRLAPTCPYLPLLAPTCPDLPLCYLTTFPTYPNSLNPNLQLYLPIIPPPLQMHLPDTTYPQADLSFPPFWKRGPHVSLTFFLSAPCTHLTVAVNPARSRHNDHQLIKKTCQVPPCGLTTGLFMR